MSAFMCGDGHFVFLVEASLAGGRHGGESMEWTDREDRTHVVMRTNAHEIARLLARENLLSMQGRYGERLESSETETPDRVGDQEEYDRLRSMLGQSGILSFMASPEPGFVFKQIDCYEYQACEHTDWRNSVARAFCDALRVRYASRVTGHKEAPWGL